MGRQSFWRCSGKSSKISTSVVACPEYNRMFPKSTFDVIIISIVKCEYVCLSQCFKNIKFGLPAPYQKVRQLITSSSHFLILLFSWLLITFFSWILITSLPRLLTVNRFLSTIWCWRKRHAIFMRSVGPGMVSSYPLNSLIMMESIILLWPSCIHFYFTDLQTLKHVYFKKISYTAGLCVLRQASPEERRFNQTKKTTF